MADILIRGIEAKTVKRLKDRAKRNGRSLQSEIRLLLDQAGGGGASTIVAMFERWNEKFAGRKFTPSDELLREDRGR